MIQWNACTQEQNILLRWLECHVALGTYLQIVGVVAAIIGSALITRWSTKRMLQPAKAEREGRARVLVYRLMPPVGKIKTTAARVRQAYQQTESGFLFAASGQLKEAVHYFRIDTVLPIDILADLHALEETTAESIAKLYFYLSQYNEFIDRNVPLLSTLDADGRAEFIRMFESLLVPVETLSSEVWQMLQQARSK